MGLEKTKNQKILNIGLAIDWTENFYHAELIRGIKDACDNQNFNLFIFVGGPIDPPEQFGDNRNILYQHISNHALDGLIISAATLSTYCDSVRLEEFCYSFGSLPLLTISADFPDFPSVTIDNPFGMKTLTEHFILEHKLKNILFIKGRDNTEGHQRYSGFKEAMSAHQLIMDSNYVQQGDLSFESGAKIIEEFLQTQLPLDAVIASNDDMARGVISVLIHHGRYPGVAVGGFDNQFISQHLSIPLTSVEQPIYDQGKHAVTNLVAFIKNRKDHQNLVLPTRLITRQSCGCTPPTLVQKIPTFPKLEGTRKEILDNFTEDLFTQLNIQDEIEKTEITKFIKSIDESLIKNSKEIFFQALNYFFSYPGYLSNKKYNKMIIFSAFHFFYQQAHTYNPFVVEIFTEALYFISERLERDIFYSLHNEQKEILQLRFYIENFVSVNSMKELTEQFAIRLPLIGVNSCFLSLYELSPEEHYPKYSRLIFGFKNRIPIDIDTDGHLFLTHFLIPEDFIDLNQKHNFTIEALFFGDTKLGFCLFEFDESKKSLWHLAKRMLMMLALKASIFVQRVQLDFSDFEAKVRARTEALSKANELLGRLYKERKEAEQALIKLNEELEIRVKERTHQLAETNQQLTDTLERLKTAQSKLVQSEKMAALGGLVAGVAHEINTPMGIGVTAASHLEKTTRELENLYKQSNLKRSDLEQYFASASEASKMVLSNLRRAHELISSFKKISVDQSNEIKRKFYLKTYLDEIIISLQPRLKKQNPLINISCPPSLEINSFPGAISQIITNLIVNSLIHGFHGIEDMKIKIHIKAQENTIFLRYFDNGKGIDQKHIKKIFDPFYTTNRIQGGTGLGLHLVFNIVTQTLQGTIKCYSRSGGGTLFKIVFPA